MLFGIWEQLSRLKKKTGTRPKNQNYTFFFCIFHSPDRSLFQFLCFSRRPCRIYFLVIVMWTNATLCLQ